MLLVTSWAQNVGINATGSTPDASAGLDVNFTDKGLLIPRVDISDLSTESPVTSPATSVLVYNTNTTTGPGYFYWDGSKWVKFFDANNGKPWILGGNAGTTAGTDFLGTTDAIDLTIATNNTERMRITSGGFVGINTTPTTLFDIDGGTGSTTQTIGTITGNSLTSGIGLNVVSNSLTSGKLVSIEATNSTDNSANTNTGLYVRNTGPYANAIQVDGAGRPNYSAIYAVSTPAADGTGFSVSTSNHTINATLSGNTSYSFAVFGRIQNAPSPSGGVIGYYASDDFGILGYNNGGHKTGVVGIGGVTTISTLTNGSGGAFTSDNVGVYGHGDATSGSAGAYCSSSASDGVGVISICSDNMGVYGSGNHYGVYGVGNNASASGYCGVIGKNQNDLGDGVIGLGSNTSTYGTSSNGDGVIGTTDNSSANGVGGYYYDGSDVERFGTLGNSNYGVYGHYSDSSYGYIGGSATGLYGYGDQASGIYAAAFDPNNSSNAFILIEGDDSHPIIRCNGNNYGRLGTSSYHWYDVYTYYLHYNTAYTFDTYDDLELLDNMIKDAKTVWDPKLKHHYMIMDKKNIPKCITAFDDKGNPNGFVDAGKAFGLTTGAIRQLNNETKDRDKRLAERTEILANAIGVDFSNINSNNVEININDFGAISSDKTIIKVAFSRNFIEKIKNSKNAPVINITPTSPYKNYYISKISKKGFEITVDKLNNSFSFNWVAFAKVIVNNKNNVNHIDNVFYRKSFKVEGNYSTYNPDEIKNNRTVDDKNIKIKPLKAFAKKVNQKSIKEIKTIDTKNNSNDKEEK